MRVQVPDRGCGKSVDGGFTSWKLGDHAKKFS